MGASFTDATDLEHPLQVEHMGTHWEDPELISEFVVEATERLDASDDGLLRLEKAAADGGALDDVMGALHSIKGSAGFVGLPRLQEACHGTEALLGALRQHVGDSGSRIDLSFDGITAMRDYLSALDDSARNDSPLSPTPHLDDYLHKLTNRGIVTSA